MKKTFINEKRAAILSNANNTTLNDLEKWFDENYNQKKKRDNDLGQYIGYEKKNRHLHKLASCFLIMAAIFIFIFASIFILAMSTYLISKYSFTNTASDLIPKTKKNSYNLTKNVPIPGWPESDVPKREYDEETQVLTLASPVKKTLPTSNVEK